MSLGYYVGPVFSSDADTGKPVVQGWAVFCSGGIVGGRVFGSFAEAFSALQYLVASADNKLEVVQRPVVELFPPEYSSHSDEQLKCLPIDHVEVLEDSEEPSEMAAPRG